MLQYQSNSELDTFFDKYTNIDIPVLNSPTQIEWIAIKDIIPIKAQRRLRYTDVKDRLKDGFDWNLFGCITVCWMPDLTYKDADGRHRLAKARVTFKDENTKVPCNVIDLRHLPQNKAEKVAAEYFLKFNGDASRNVSPVQRFWAQIIAEDPKALQLNAILKETGCYTGKANSQEEGGNGTIDVKFDALQKSFKMSPEALKYSIALMQTAWPAEKRLEPNFLGGLTRLLSLKGFTTKSGEYIPTKYHELCGRVSNGKAVAVSQKGKVFLEWIKFVGPNYAMNDPELKFNDKRNTPNYFDGIACGIYEKFHRWATNQPGDLPKHCVRPIGKFYRTKVNTHKSERSSDRG